MSVDLECHVFTSKKDLCVFETFNFPGQAVIHSAKDFINFVNKGVSPYHGEPRDAMMTSLLNMFCSGAGMQAQVGSSRF